MLVSKAYLIGSVHLHNRYDDQSLLQILTIMITIQVKKYLV